MKFVYIAPMGRKTITIIVTKNNYDCSILTKNRLTDRRRLVCMRLYSTANERCLIL
ncbi:MAG: hypothetical protein LBP59_13780 [Planctomycetaceae bacterium]|nr:hypothetical protein [Planctomycetaceae bacterium]